MINVLPDYKKATNLAYEVLQKYNGVYPQIDILAIAHNYPQVKLHTFSEFASRLGITVADFTNEHSESDTGFTVYDTLNQRWLMFYNDTKCETTIRFTIAHELGHIVLKHTEDTLIADKEANCFARNVLCPVPIRCELELLTQDDYCLAFNISDAMAQVVISLNHNDIYYITKNSYDTISTRMHSFLQNVC